MRLTVTPETFPLARAFTISRGSRTEARVLTVTVEAEGMRGRGECVPYPRYGETLDSVATQIAGLPAVVRPGGAAAAAAAGGGAQRRRLRPLGSRGEAGRAAGLGARRARRSRTGDHRLHAVARHPRGDAGAGGGERGAAAPEGQARRRRATSSGSRRFAPARRRARIVVDANEGWTAEAYATLAPALVALGVEMVEQPLPAGADDALAGMARPLPVCADESCHDRASLPALAGKYDMVNIKLDKTGGLTEALALRAAARAAGYGVMVGCMVGSSLGMAPAVLLAQGAEVVDLDGPLLLARDRDASASLRRTGRASADARALGVR